MTVLILERASPGERGQLTKWMTEIASGVFVGRLRKPVRERLWMNVAQVAAARGASAVMVWRTNSAQGFSVRVSNPEKRFAEDVDGVWLMRLP